VSRRHCHVCGVTHENKSWGLCDKHLQEKEQKKEDDEYAESRILASFMEHSEEDRWEKVFDFMRLHGWSP
jgi:hypothetical protein